MFKHHIDENCKSTKNCEVFYVAQKHILFLRNSGNYITLTYHTVVSINNFRTATIGKTYGKANCKHYGCDYMQYQNNSVEPCFARNFKFC